MPEVIKMNDGNQSQPAHRQPQAQEDAQGTAQRKEGLRAIDERCVLP